MTILDSDEIWTALTKFMGSESELQRLTGEVSNADDSGGEGHPNVDWAHEAAEDEIRSIVAGVAEWPLDGWPPFLERVLCAITIANVTTGADRRPEWIESREKWADGVLEDIKKGKRGVRDTDTATDAGARLASSASQFRDDWDADSADSEIRLRRPGL